MSKATSIKEALDKWEKANDQDCSTATEVGLEFQYPPIEKMDKNLSRLTACEKLSLSTNMIERIIGVAELTNLTILSLGRNNLKSLGGLEPLNETLQELWISYNSIEKLQPLEGFRKLKVFYMAHNLVRDWGEVNKLGGINTLEDMVLIGNPLQENNDETTYKREVTKRLKSLKKIDGEPIIREGD